MLKLSIILLITSLLKVIYCDKAINPSNCGYRLNDLVSRSNKPLIDTLFHNSDNNNNNNNNNITGLISNEKTQRSILRNEAQPGDWGWQVAIDFDKKFICGGALINTQWIITSAKCVYGRDVAARYKIVIGVHDKSLKDDEMEPWSTVRLVDKVITHPDYKTIDLSNNIALIKLIVSVFSNPLLLIRIFFLIFQFNNLRLQLNIHNSLYPFVLIMDKMLIILK
jgi:hypothetical protein